MENRHYMNMSAIMLALRNEQSRQEKKKVKVIINGSGDIQKSRRAKELSEKLL